MGTRPPYGLDYSRWLLRAGVVCARTRRRRAGRAIDGFVIALEIPCGRLQTILTDSIDYVSRRNLIRGLAETKYKKTRVLGRAARFVGAAAADRQRRACTGVLCVDGKRAVVRARVDGPDAGLLLI